MIAHHHEPPDRACRRHRALILAIVETGEFQGPERIRGRVAALAGPEVAEHLDACAGCSTAAASAALAITRVEGWAREVVAVEVPSDGWPRLRTRIEGSRRRAREAAWRARANLAGLAASSLIVAVVVGPLAISGSSQGWTPTSEPGGPSSRDRFVGVLERQYVERSQSFAAGTAVAAGEDELITPSQQRLLPDGYKPSTKEVNPTETTAPTRDVS